MSCRIKRNELRNRHKSIFAIRVNLRPLDTLSKIYNLLPMYVYIQKVRMGSKQLFIPI